MIFLLKKIRKLFKSLGKLEFWILDKITLALNIKEKKKLNYNLKNHIFDNIYEKICSKKNNPKKIIIVVCFYFNIKKIKVFDQTLVNLNLLNLNKEIIIITNQINSTKRKILYKLLKKRISKFDLIQVNNLPDENLLPWYSINIMREKIKIKSNTHFLYIEDDILIKKININYWIYFRKILKKFSLVPSFVRYELLKNKKISLDNPKILHVNKSPNILSNNKKNGFINSKYPYHAMYLMDRELMKKYLSNGASKVDFSFFNSFMKRTYPIKELLNISHSYQNIPKGFYNNLVFPIMNMKIPEFCLIQHNQKKYSKFNKLTKLGYGTIQVSNLVK